AANAAIKEKIMKRLQLCASVTAVILGITATSSVHAGDKGGAHQNLGSARVSQGGSLRSNMQSTSGQNNGMASNLKKQVDIGAKGQSNLGTNIKSNKIDPGQTKKGNGPQGNNQQTAKKNSQDPKMKQHFEGIKDHCYFGKDCHFWSEHCWNAKFGC